MGNVSSWHKVALQGAGFWACEWPLSGAEATKWRDPLFGGYRRKADRIQIDQKMIRGSLHIKDDSATPGSQVPPGTLFP